jgi:hypothetical protein
MKGPSSRLFFVYVCGSLGTVLLRYRSDEQVAHGTCCASPAGADREGGGKSGPWPPQFSLSYISNIYLVLV